MLSNMVSRWEMRFPRPLMVACWRVRYARCARRSCVRRRCRSVNLCIWLIRVGLYTAYLIGAVIWWFHAIFARFSRVLDWRNTRLSLPSVGFHRPPNCRFGAQGIGCLLSVRIICGDCVARKVWFLILRCFWDTWFGRRIGAGRKLRGIIGGCRLLYELVVSGGCRGILVDIFPAKQRQVTKWLEWPRLVHDAGGWQNRAIWRESSPQPRNKWSLYWNWNQLIDITTKNSRVIIQI
jgi:hypothetical protein